MSGHVGGPLSDTLKWSVAADYRDTNGYYSNKNTGSTYSPRTPTRTRAAMIAWTTSRAGMSAGGCCGSPATRMNVDAKLRYGEVDARLHHVQLRLPSAGPFVGASAPTFAENVNDHTFGFNPNIKPFNNQDATEFSVKVDYDLGFADLTAWGLYSDIKNDFGADGTSGAFGFFNTDQRCIDTTTTGNARDASPASR